MRRCDGVLLTTLRKARGKRIFKLARNDALPKMTTYFALLLTLLVLLHPLYIVDVANALALKLPSLPADTWLPIASISSLGNDLPLGIEVCGEKLVVWKDNDQQWAVMADICSHRHAPLSEGRIDEKGCLECPYHGQTFSASGACTKIPQLEASKAIPPSSDVTSYKTKVLGDMLFAQIALPTETQYSTSPEELFPILANISSFTTRDLPYSFDYLLENFMDPGTDPNPNTS